MSFEIAAAADWTERACCAVCQALKRPLADLSLDRGDRLAVYLARRGRRGLPLQCVDCGDLLTEQTIGDEVAEGLLCEPCAESRRDEDPPEPDPPEYEREEDRDA